MESTKYPAQRQDDKEARRPCAGSQGHFCVKRDGDGDKGFPTALAFLNQLHQVHALVTGTVPDRSFARFSRSCSGSATLSSRLRVASHTRHSPVQCHSLLLLAMPTPLDLIRVLKYTVPTTSQSRCQLNIGAGREDMQR